jgi:WD40 repeat protein
MLVVWDSLSATPVRTFLNPHVNGVKTMDLSADCKYIVTLGNEEEVGKMQTISLWDWLNETEEGPIVSLAFKYEALSNHWVKFNPENPFEIACNGERRMSFLSWEHGKTKFDHYSPRCEKGDFSHKIRWEAKYTKTVFIPGGNKAVTGTERGDILVWD